MATKKGKKVKIRVLPLHGIGGIGDVGATGWVTKEEADQYVADGYAEIVTDEEPVAVPSTVKEDEAVKDEEEATSESEPEDEDHKIMKPESKRE